MAEQRTAPRRAPLTAVGNNSVPAPGSKRAPPPVAPRRRAPRPGDAECRDLVRLSPLHEDRVLDVLNARFASGQLYSFAGPTLVAINPYTAAAREAVPAAFAQRYHDADDVASLPVHVFSLAERAYRTLRRAQTTQTEVPLAQVIVLSGQSGAGKTFSANTLVNYLADTCSPTAQQTERGATLAERIISAGPLLEAFGNAATTNNANSSRFGKYIQLHFDDAGALSAASLKVFLLELSRVVHQLDNEQNYHIFNLLRTSAASDGLQERRTLDSVRYALASIGLDSAGTQAVFDVVNGVAVLASSSKQFADLDAMLAAAAQLLDLPYDKLHSHVCTRHVAAGGETFVSTRSHEEQLLMCHSLAKHCYNLVFQGLVSRLNAAWASPTTTASQTSGCIGLLDIFGFENCGSNSLEQLCINFANERLQHHYVQHMVEAERQLFEREGLTMESPAVVDNAACLALLAGPVSIFNLLNEDSRLKRRRSQCSELQLVQRLTASLAGTSGFLAPTAALPAEFGVVHYAGTVHYNSKLLASKNKDMSSNDLLALLACSSRSILVEGCVSGAAVSSTTATGRTKRDTVTSKYLQSIKALFSEIEQGNPFYIRCLASNNHARARHYDRAAVAQQLRACGIVDSLRIYALGRPCHVSYATAQKRYGPLLSIKQCSEGENSTAQQHQDKASSTIQCQNKDEENSTREAVCAMLRRCLGSEADFLAGRTMAFLTDRQLQVLDDCLDAYYAVSVAKIQTWWRGARDRRTFLRLRDCTVRLQRSARGWIRRRQLTTAVCRLKPVLSMLIARAVYGPRLVDAKQALAAQHVQAILAAERIEAERIEAERIEAERIEAERIEAERIEAERANAAQLAVQLATLQLAAAERSEAERTEGEHTEGQRVEAQPAVQQASAEADCAVQQTTIEGAAANGRTALQLTSVPDACDMVSCDRSAADMLLGTAPTTYDMRDTNSNAMAMGATRAMAMPRSPALSARLRVPRSLQDWAALGDAAAYNESVTAAAAREVYLHPARPAQPLPLACISCATCRLTRREPRETLATRGWASPAAIPLRWMNTLPLQESSAHAGRSAPAGLQCLLLS